MKTAAQFSSCDTEGTSQGIEFPFSGPALTRVVRAQAPGEKEETVLVAEHNYGACESLCRMLWEQGYRVLAASDVADTVRLIAWESEALRAAVVSLSMPVYDVLATLHAVQALAPTARCLVIGTPAEAATLAKAVHPDTVHVLPKPFEPDELLRSLREALDS